MSKHRATYVRPVRHAYILVAGLAASAVTASAALTYVAIAALS